jgi:ABC-2 type transport system permease protein
VSVTSAASAVSDGFVIAKRNLIKIKRVPDLLVGTTLAPIIFVVMFGYVFGGAVAVQGSNYRVFLMAGIFTQTVVFGSTITGTGLAMDIQTGIIDRFRSLPMSPSAVLFGRTLSDLVNNVLVVIVMSLTGLAIGWRISSSFLEALGGFMILLAFAYAFSWIMAMVGLLVPSPEVVNNASFVVIFPVTFVANTFVPLNTLPGPLRSFAEWNPVSSVTEVARQLFGNIPPGTRVPNGWALQHPLIYTLGWCVAILVIFVPLTTRQFHRSVSR